MVFKKLYKEVRAEVKVGQSATSRKRNKAIDNEGFCVVLTRSETVLKFMNSILAKHISLDKGRPSGKEKKSW